MRKRGISEGGALGCGDVTPPALERRGCHKSGHPPRPLFQLRLFLAPIPQLETVLGGGWGRGPCHRKAGTKLWGAACPLASAWTTNAFSATEATLCFRFLRCWV